MTQLPANATPPRANRVMDGLIGAVLGAGLTVAAAWSGPIQVRDDAIDSLAENYRVTARHLESCRAGVSDVIPSH